MCKRIVTCFVLLAVAAISTAQAQSTQLRIEGGVSYERQGNQVTLNAERICNRSTSRRSGTVHIGLWATTDANPVGSGYSLAETSLSTTSDPGATLDPNACFTGIRFATSWTTPAAQGVYYVHFYVAEHPNTAAGPGTLTFLDHLTFNNRLTVGNPTPPPAPPPPSPGTPSGDDHGNTTASATSVAVPSTTSGNLETAGDIDVFSFTLSASTAVSIHTLGATDTTGELRNASGTVIDFNDDAGVGNTNFSIPSTTLAAGTYYVRVAGYAEVATGAYQLVITGAPTSSPPPPPPSASNTGGGEGDGGGGFVDLMLLGLLVLLIAAKRLARLAVDFRQPIGTGDAGRGHALRLVVGSLVVAWSIARAATAAEVDERSASERFEQCLSLATVLPVQHAAELICHRRATASVLDAPLTIQLEHFATIAERLGQPDSPALCRDDLETEAGLAALCALASREHAMLISLRRNAAAGQTFAQYSPVTLSTRRVARYVHNVATAQRQRGFAQLADAIRATLERNETNAVADQQLRQVLRQAQYLASVLHPSAGEWQAARATASSSLAEYASALLALMRRAGSSVGTTGGRLASAAALSPASNQTPLEDELALSTLWATHAADELRQRIRELLVAGKIAHDSTEAMLTEIYAGQMIFEATYRAGVCAIACTLAAQGARDALVVQGDLSIPITIVP